MGIADGWLAGAGAGGGGPEVARWYRGGLPAAERSPVTEKTLGGKGNVR
ncbi:hypothetical protein TIFTF001_007031 [Ficus carica]|uniref:Uncharacterized protein n=1 Tax=Ficus carica TaxID=3494 RepID=A0AA88CZ92_FICCA|nr:hypothetical protein TIFTF001_007031 [Ficus carica]